MMNRDALQHRLAELQQGLEQAIGRHGLAKQAVKDALALVYQFEGAVIEVTALLEQEDDGGTLAPVPSEEG